MESEGSIPCPQGHILSQMNPIHTLPPYLSIIILPTPRSSKWSLPSCFPTKILHAFLISSVRVTSPAHHTLFDLITLIIHGEEWTIFSILPLHPLSLVHSCYLTSTEIPLNKCLIFFFRKSKEATCVCFPHHYTASGVVTQETNRRGSLRCHIN
jgi:hypothetical protein